LANKGQFPVSGGHYWRAKGNGVMKFLAPFTKLTAVFRKFVAPRYPP
jgi:hypothetical protein